MDPAHGVPKKIWLYPLPGGDAIYRSLSDSAATKVTDTLEQFDRLAGRLQALEKRKAVQTLPNIAATMKQFHENFTKFLSTFKNEIKELHSEIKRKAKEEKQLLKVLDKLHKLPFAAENIKRWVDSREEEADILKVAEELPKPCQPCTAKCRVALVVKVYSGKPDVYCQSLGAAVRTYRENGCHILDIHKKKSEDEHRTLGCMFTDQHKTIIQQFDHCYQNLRNDHDVQFELVEKPSMENSDDKGPVYFEVHDKASHQSHLTDNVLLPNGVSSVEVRYKLVKRVSPVSCVLYVQTFQFTDVRQWMASDDTTHATFVTI